MPDSSTQGPLPAAIPGKSRDEVLTLARHLSAYDLSLRLRRVLTDKRRFLEFRRTTDEVLTKIRYSLQRGNADQVQAIGHKLPGKVVSTTPKFQPIMRTHDMTCDEARQVTVGEA